MCKNTTLKIVEKRREFKVFEGILMCLNVFRGEREREKENLPKTA